MFHFLSLACFLFSFSLLRFLSFSHTLFFSVCLHYFYGDTDLSFMRQGPIPALYSNRQAAAQGWKRKKKEDEREKKVDISVCECQVISVASTRTARTCPGLVSQSTKDYARLSVGASLCVCARVFTRANVCVNSYSVFIECRDWFYYPSSVSRNFRSSRLLFIFFYSCSPWINWSILLYEDICIRIKHKWWDHKCAFRSSLTQLREKFYRKPSGNFGMEHSYMNVRGIPVLFTSLKT